MLFTLGADCPGPADLDEGFHVAADGTVLQPGIPATVEATADALPAAEAAVAWWNAELDCEALELVESNADILVTTGLVPDHGDPGADGVPIGLAEVDYAEDGTVLGGTITIAYEIAYDEATAAQVATHELGHLPFGLADDPGPPETVDLRSIMASPLDPLGELTAADRARLLPFCP